MKWLWTACLLIPHLSLAQPAPEQQVMQTISVPGHIEVPSFVHMEVSMQGSGDVRFEDFADYSQPRILPANVQLRIESTVPWMVMVKSASPYFYPGSESGTSQIPADLISVRRSGSGPFIPVSTTPQVVMSSTSNDMVSQHNIDVRIDPPWNMKGSQYQISLMFYISPQ
jgi:hypothetical protein